MSHGPHQESAPQLENPLALHIRNFPVSLLSTDKFHECICDWRGVDVVSSSCHQNPNNPAWNGWAIVHFQSEQARNSFLGNENQHYVKDSFGDIHKLKVKKWFEKPGSNLPAPSPGRSNPVSISHNQTHKQDNFVYRDPTLEEFEKRASDCSNPRSFRGIIKSYLSENGGHKSSKSGGDSGILAVKVLHQGRVIEELVLFHSACVCICTTHSHCWGTQDCARICTPADNLPAKLKPETQVYFTARRVPADTQCAVRYQARCVWQGEPLQPDFVSTPVRIKLDQYLDQYLEHLEAPGTRTQSHQDVTINNNIQQQRLKSLSPGPPDYQPHQNKLQHPQTKTGSNGVVPIRQKPLTGGLKQLNTDLSKKYVARVEKRQTPTNFAEAAAVGGSGGFTSDNYAETTVTAAAAGIVEIAIIEYFPAKDRVVVNVKGFGSFHLDPSHFEDSQCNVNDLQSYLRDCSTVLVALNQAPADQPGLTKSAAGPSYVVVKAFAGDKEPNSVAPSAKHNITNGQHYTAPDAVNDSKVVVNGTKIQRRRNESSAEIDLDELDRYYDTQHEIAEYLRNKICVLLPELRPGASNFVDSLVNNIIAAEEEGNYSGGDTNFKADVDILSRYLNHPKYNISSAQRQKFIAEYSEFRRSLYAKPDDNNTNNNKVVNGTSSKVSENTSDQHLHNNSNTTANNLNLTAIEKEFFDNRQNDTECQSSIHRVIILLRKANIQLDNITRMYRDHVQMHGKTKNKIFYSRLQSYLSTKLTQKLLEETNLQIQRMNTSGVETNTTRVSCRKLEAYLPAITYSLCGYLFSSQPGSQSKDVMSSETSTMDTISSSGGSGSSSPMRSIPSTKSASHKGSNVPSAQEEYGKLEEYLSCIKADEVQLVKTLRQKHLGLQQLYDIFDDCKNVGEGGKMKWNLEMSKLKLNPAIGVTVFRIAEILWNYFHSHPCEKKLDLQPPEDYLAVYDTNDFAALRKGLVFHQLEEDLVEGIEILCYDDIGGQNSIFTCPDDLKDYASMIGKVWRSCGQDPASLEKDIQHTINNDNNVTFENYFNPLRAVLGKWAAKLENHSLKDLIDTEINVFNILQATLTSYHPNVFEGYNCGEEEDLLLEETKHNIALFRNIVSSNSSANAGFHLYAAEGFFHGYLEDFIIIQTQFCKVLMHPSVFIDSGYFMADSAQLKDDYLTGVILVNCVPVLDSSNSQVIFHVATLAWKSKLDRESGGQTYQGILAPFPRILHKNIEESARRIVTNKEDTTTSFKVNDSEDELVSFGKLMLDILDKSNNNRKLDFVRESMIFSLLISADLLDNNNVLETTLLSDGNFRYMTQDEFLAILDPYLQTLSLYKDMKNTLDKILVANQHHRSKVVSKFLAKYSSRYERFLLVGEAVEKGEGEEQTEEEVDSNHEVQINVTAVKLFAQQIKENNDAIESFGKRLSDLEKVVRGLLNVKLPNSDGGSVQERSYVRICAEVDGEVEEVPTNRDGLLPLATIQSIFGGAQGLKYRVSSGQAGSRVMWRNLVLENGLLYPPSEGWGDVIYLARGCGPTMNYVSGGQSNACNPPITVNGGVSGVNSNYLNSHLHQMVNMGGGVSASMTTSSANHQQHVSTASVMQQQQQQHQRKTSLSQLVVNQTPSSIWGSSPAPILGGISPVSLDFQESSNNFGLRDQLN